MIRHMIGRDLTTLYRSPASPPGDAVLELRGVSTSYRPVGRSICASVAGTSASRDWSVSGRTELARTIFGLDAPVAGEVCGQWRAGCRRAGRERRSRAACSWSRRIANPSGLVLDFPIPLERHPGECRPLFAPRPDRHGSRKRAEAASQRERLDIRTPSPSATRGALSGGNQQKVVLGKWLAMAPQVLVFDQPTRGIDVGAKTEIYPMMRELAANGVPATLDDLVRHGRGPLLGPWATGHGAP